MYLLKNRKDFWNVPCNPITGHYENSVTPTSSKTQTVADTTTPFGLNILRQAV